MAIKQDLINHPKKIELLIEKIDFDQQVDNNKNKYETFNVVSETGDSIYSPLLKELPIEEKGQVFISEDEIEEVVQADLDKKVGALKQER